MRLKRSNEWKREMSIKFEEAFICWKNWPADNFDEYDWLCSDPVSDCLSQLWVHSWEKTKYNQQQRQIKQVLQCKSKSKHWLQAVKKRRKEIVDLGQNSDRFLTRFRSRLMLSLPHLLLVMSTNGLVWIHWMPVLLQLNVCEACSEYVISLIQLWANWVSFALSYIAWYFQDI